MIYIDLMLIFVTIIMKLHLNPLQVVIKRICNHLNIIVLFAHSQIGSFQVVFTNAP